jgi:hypothetical protein
MTATAQLTLDDLCSMDARGLHAIVTRAHPLDVEAMAGKQYLGVDLSLPAWMNRLLWKTFRKTFYRDPATGVLRGWNVRLEQRGVEGPSVPLTDRRGRALSFGHYQVRSAEGVHFPRGWRGPHYLDYGVAGNLPWDPARFGFTPLVSVNAGSADLLLGWEVFRLGPLFVPLPDYWALRVQGPIDEVVAPPRPPRA